MDISSPTSKIACMIYDEMRARNCDLREGFTMDERRVSWP